MLAVSEGTISYVPVKYGLTVVYSGVDAAVEAPRCKLAFIFSTATRSEASHNSISAVVCDCLAVPVCELLLCLEHIRK